MERAKIIDAIVRWGAIGFVVYAFYCMVASSEAYADDRVMPNGLSGAVTLTDKPCDIDIHYKDEVMKLVTATIVLDGEMQEVKACYFETGPTPEVKQDEVDTAALPKMMKVQLFNMIHIKDVDGTIYNMSAEDFK